MTTEIARIDKATFVANVRTHASVRSGPVPQIMGQFGGRLYPEKSSPKCRVCKSPSRRAVDDALRDMVAIRTIWEWLPEDADLKIAIPEYKNFYRTVANHSKEHAGMAVALARIETEQRAAALGLDIEKMQGYLVDHIMVLDTVMAKGLQRIVAGNEPVDASTAVRAARAKAAIVAAQANSVDTETMTEAFASFLRITREVMGNDEQFKELGQRIRTDPILMALADRVQRQQEAHEPLGLGS